jgi:hypothetical protein
MDIGYWLPYGYSVDYFSMDTCMYVKLACMLIGYRIIYKYRLVFTGQGDPTSTFLCLISQKLTTLVITYHCW